jgi:nucleoside-diphosphate-sugar epimerase
MKILVTGATGFVGKHVVDALLQQQQFEITVTASKEDSLQAYYSELPLKMVAFDIFGERNHNLNLFEFFGAPDKVIHLAWRGLPNYGRPFHVTENVATDFSFLKNLIDFGLKDLTITGTCFEYGMLEGELAEDMAGSPANYYALGKDTLRRMLEIYQGQQTYDLKWVRLFYMFGQGQNPNSLLASLITAITRGDKEFNMSAGMQLRDYLSVEVAAENIITIALQSKVLGIINNCSGTPVRVLDFVKTYLAENIATIKLNLGYYPYSPFEPMEFWGNTDKLKAVLNH